MQTQKPKQKFVVSRRKDSPFKPGFRSYFVDRDLGLRQATGGAFMAEVHKASGPVPKGGGGMHLHHIDFQFNYMLKGWCKVEIEGEGVLRFEINEVSGVEPYDVGVPGPGRIVTADTEFFNNAEDPEGEFIYLNTVRGTGARTVVRADVTRRRTITTSPML